MNEMLARLFWIAALSCAFAYIFFLLFGSLFERRIVLPIVMHDTLTSGEHTVTGMVMLPTPCTQLSVKTRQLSTTMYSFELRTWDDPSVNCPRIDTPRAFNAVAFAPSFGVQFLVFLDGKTVPFNLIPVMPKKTI